MNVFKQIAFLAFFISIPVLSVKADDYETPDLNYARLFVPGEEGTLPQKLVVTDMNALLYKDFSQKPIKIEPLTILWRLKIEGASNPKDPVVEYKGKTYYCVGGPGGNEWGYMETTKVTPWMTRYVFAPAPPKSDCVFRVFNKSYQKKEYESLSEKQVEDATVAKISDVPPGFSSFAFVLNDKDGNIQTGDGITTDPDSFKSVMIYNTPISGGATGKVIVPPSQVTAEAIGLDVVFVIDTTGSMKPMIDQVKTICLNISKQVNYASSKGKNVHFGLVEYRDSESKEAGDKFGARVVCDLKQNYATFLSRLNDLAVSGGYDYPEDVILGLKTAVDKANWNKFSSKHIILIGDAENKVTKASGDLTNFEKLYEYANPDKVPVDMLTKKLKQFHFHAIVGEDTDRINHDPNFSFARVQKEFHKVAENNDNDEGYYGNMVTDKNIANDVSVILMNAINAVNSDDLNDDEAGKGGVIARSVWDLKKFVSQLQPGDDHNKALGYACIFTNDAKKCASLNIMVLKDDMEDFVDALSSAYRRLDKLSGGGSGNVKVIFDKFLEEFVGIVSGDATEDDYEMDLEKILGLQIPVKTKTLKKTIKDVMRMSDKERKNWMNDIKDARDRAKDILNKKEAWVETYHAPNQGSQKFAFISVDDLP